MAQVLKRFNFATLFCLVLSLASIGQAAASANVRVNGIGYPTAVSKRATVLTAAGANAFNVRRVSDNSSAFAGTLTGTINNIDTGETVRFANFDALTEQGQFYLDVTGVGTSVNFSIADDVYNNATWVNLMGFYNQRCGMATSMTYNGDTWAHATCHMGDGNLSYYSGSNTTKNGTGGWHDAGDFGKYTVNAGITVGQMLQAWERFKSELSSLNTPVGSNAAMPDYLEEMKWEMDWVLKMQFPDGRVSHKLTRTNFEPYPLFPQADLATRYYVPWGSAATASFVAMCAIAARQFQPYDAAYATTLQNAATLSYNYLVANPADVQANQTGFGTGGYGTTDEDDRIWAAAEMWELTGNAAQLADLETRINAHGADKSDYNWDWGDVSNLGMYTYVLSTRTGKNATYAADVRNDILVDANAMVTAANAHGYGRALGNYYWGANGTVLRQCEHLDVANRLSPNVNYLGAAQQQLSWALGRNYFNRSQITGLGINPAMNPHDRESSADAVVAPKPGHLVGGGHPNATSWVDDENDYAQNEIAINWDGATAYALAMWYKGPAAPTPTPTFSRSPTFSPSPTASPTRTPLPCGPDVVHRRLRAQGTNFIDSAGNTWLAEQAYIAGGWGYAGGTQAAPYAGAIAGTTNDGLYQSERYGDPVGYRFTVPNGAYRVLLKFSENYFNAPAARRFDVLAEGQTAVNDLDIYATAGQYSALDISFTVDVYDGILTLDFDASLDNANVAAIEVTQLFGGACASPTSTITATRSATRTPTPSASASSSATRTPTPSPTVSPSATATPSRTPTASPSATPSISTTPSGSPTTTVSSTQTLSPTPSETADGSFTITLTVTVTPTVTLTFTVTSSASATLSSSPTETALGSFTFTLTPTATPSSTFSASPTESFTPTETGTPSDTASPTASSSATATHTALGSATHTGTRTATPTFSATPTNTPSHSPGTAATLAPSGDPKVLQAQPVPQPQAGPSFNFAVQIVGGVADTVELKLYTRAYTLLGTYKAKGNFGQGWNHPVRFDIPDLPNGIYFTRTTASVNGKVSKTSKSGRLYVLR